MPTYIVTNKQTGAEVYRYFNDIPIEWDGMSFADCDHTAEPEPAPVPPAPAVGRVMSKLEYLRRFTQVERIAIREAAKQSPELDDYLRLLELAEEINTVDVDTIAAVRMLEAAGLLMAGRAAEVLS